MNKVILVGNITKDIEITTTNSGISVARFSVAVQRRFTNSEGEREADFINIVAWRSTAEFISKYFKKGSKIGIVGNIQTRNYEADDGTRRYVTEVVAEEVEFAGAKKTEDGDAPEEKEDKKTKGKKSAKQPELEPVDDDSLPF